MAALSLGKGAVWVQFPTWALGNGRRPVHGFAVTVMVRVLGRLQRDPERGWIFQRTFADVCNHCYIAVYVPLDYWLCRRVLSPEKADRNRYGIL